MKTNCPTKKLGEVCEIKKGKNPPLHDLQSKGFLPYLSAKFLRGTQQSKFADPNDKKSVLVSSEDLIIICDGSKSGDIFSGFEGILSSTMGRIDTDKYAIDKKYLWYYIIKNFDNLNTGKKGAAIPHLDYKVFNNLIIPLPLLEEQKRIVKLLEEKLRKVKETIRLRQDAIVDTEKILSTKLSEIFTVGKEKGWEEKELGDIVEFQNGKAHEQHIKPDGAFKVINSKFISSNGIIYKESDKQLTPLVKNDVVMVMSDVPNGKTLAKCYLVESDDTYTLNQRIGCFRVKNNKELDAKYLFIQLNRNEQLLSYDKGRGQTNLRKNDILEIKISIPDLITQEKIVKELDELSVRVAELRALQEEQLADLKSLERAYLHEAFNGELV